MSKDCSRRSIVIALVLLIAVAALLRLWHLELRPPHHDEGVNGWFIERMHKSGYYAYDPRNYHGPSYFYLLAASRELLGFGLWQLRLPCALIGTAACFIPLLLRRRIGWPATLASCALLATSPTLVYYARYAIHETLLASLGLLAAACMLRWADRGRVGWIVGAATCIAAMVATKETTIVFLAAGGAWLLGESAVESVRGRAMTVLGNRWTWSWRLLIVAGIVLATMMAVHVIAFTGGFKVPGSISDQLYRSVQSYVVWSKTGTDHGGHVKDVCYYVHLGARYDLVLYLLAIVGAVAGFRQRAIRGCAIVGFAMLAVYSAIPYKMPWLPMSWIALLAIPAGFGALRVVAIAQTEIAARLSPALVIVVMLIAPLCITRRSSFVQPADVSEALAYVHTDADYNRWFPYVETAATAVGARRVVVAVDHEATWPLAWSLLPYRKTRWSARGDEHVIIAAQSRAAAIEHKLASPYFRISYRFREAAEPVMVYLKRSTFAPLLGNQRSAFTLIAAKRVDAVAHNQPEGR